MDPGGDLELRVVLDRPELGDCCLGLLLRVERLIEIDLELRGLVAELDLRVRYRRRGCRRDGRGHLLRHARGGDRGSIGCRRWSLRLFGRTPASAELDGRLGMLGEMNGSVVGRAFLCVVVSHLVRMLALPACLPLGELLLEAARVEEDQLGQLACPAGGDDRAVEACVDDMRDQPAVVEMSVRQENRVDPGRVVGERHAVADGLVWTPLEHATVDEDAGTLRDEQELGAGDRRGPAEEEDLHPRSVAGRLRWRRGRDTQRSRNDLSLEARDHPASTRRTASRSPATTGTSGRRAGG